MKSWYFSKFKSLFAFVVNKWKFIQNEYPLIMLKSNKSMIHYPKTMDSLNIISKQEYVDILNDSLLFKWVERNETFKRLNCSDEILNAISFIKKFDSQFLSSEVDTIRFYKQGICVLTIFKNEQVFKEMKFHSCESISLGEKLNRSIHFDLNKFQSLVDKTMKIHKWSIFVLSFILSISLTWVIYCFYKQYFSSPI